MIVRRLTVVRELVRAVRSSADTVAISDVAARGYARTGADTVAVSDTAWTSVAAGDAVAISDAA